VKRRQRSEKFGRYQTTGGEIGGSHDSGEVSFFVQYTTSYCVKFPTTHFHQIWRRHGDTSCTFPRRFSTEISQTFPLVVVCAKNLKLEWCKTWCKTLPAYNPGRHYIEIPFGCCSPTAREFSTLVNFLLFALRSFVTVFRPVTVDCNVMCYTSLFVRRSAYWRVVQ